MSRTAVDPAQEVADRYASDDAGLGPLSGLHVEVVLPMSFRRGFVRPALAFVVAALLVLAAIGVFRATQDSVASRGDDATESGSTGPRGKTARHHLGFHRLAQVEAGSGSRERWLGYRP